jgi:DNA polymerase
MAKKLDPGTKRALAEWIHYYRELGVYEFYRRGEQQNASARESLPGSAFVALASSPAEAANTESLPASAPPLEPGPVDPSPCVGDPDPEAALRQIREDLGDCTRCVLHQQGRKQIVFGVGNARAKLMFIGEAPGADEDQQGIPFVGRAGQLLTNMIAAMGIRREDVYIANIIKCRPPGNRTPEREECATCSPFLMRQIDVIKPEVIVALGAVAAKTLLQVNEPMSALRGRWFDFRGIRLAVTYHPAYLLRDPRQKAETWKDLQMVMKHMGLKPPAKTASNS